MAVLVALALPGTALAADTTTNVTGAIGSELSLAASAPASMTLTHATPGTTASVVSVTSTTVLWTLSIKDANASSPGQMDRLSGDGPASLELPLQWKLSTSQTWNNLASSPATITTGSLVGSALVDFRQPLNATEDVQVTDTYGLTVTYTVT